MQGVGAFRMPSWCKRGRTPGTGTTTGSLAPAAAGDRYTKLGGSGPRGAQVLKVSTDNNRIEKGICHG